MRVTAGDELRVSLPGSPSLSDVFISRTMSFTAEANTLPHVGLAGFCLEIHKWKINFFVSF